MNQLYNKYRDPVPIDFPIESDLFNFSDFMVENVEQYRENTTYNLVHENELVTVTVYTNGYRTVHVYTNNRHGSLRMPAAVDYYGDEPYLINYIYNYNFHRPDGPAIIFYSIANGKKHESYFINGIYLSESIYNHTINKIKEDTLILNGSCKKNELTGYRLIAEHYNSKNVIEQLDQIDILNRLTGDDDKC